MVVHTARPRKIRRRVTGVRVPAARFVGLASSMVGDMLLGTKVDGTPGHADAGEIHVDFMSISCREVVALQSTGQA